MTVGGSDCSGGAGVQADLKTFCQMGVYALSAVTCVVAEHAEHVGSVVEIHPDVVFEQIRLCCEAFEIGAVKTGMLPNADIIDVVEHSVINQRLKLVVDPVIVASTGTRLISLEAVNALKKKLLPLCLVMTPNLDEAALLLGREQIGESELESCAAQLAEKFGCAVFLKGGHLPGKVARDVLFFDGGVEFYSAEKITGVNTHGTGCTLSAALTAALAQGQDLPSACATAKKFVTSCIASSLQTRLGRLLNHQWCFRQHAG